MMQKPIHAALISVFYKDGLEPLVRLLSENGVAIYSTGGTQQYIEQLGLECIPVESVTDYPSILGGRVKTLHPKIFGGILGRRAVEQDLAEMKEYAIPQIDLVIVDLYPFEETVANTTEEKLIIEKIDIGGPSMIRAAAKNFSDLVVIASKSDYAPLVDILREQECTTTLEQRRSFAAKAFDIVGNYDVAIAQYFTADNTSQFLHSSGNPQIMRYGENPHQQGIFFGKLDELFEQLNGKDLSYNNLVDVEAAVQLIAECKGETESTFAIIKHTNVCGIATRENAAFDADALEVLTTKKNRILLIQKKDHPATKQFKSLLNGVLVQDQDKGNFEKWEDTGARATSEEEKTDLIFANKVCKHLKSNAIAIAKNKQLIGKGCGQTSRIDSLRHAIEKARQFNFDLKGSVLASDAFFPFDDCVKMSHAEGIEAFIQPGGSIRDKDSIAYCKENGLAMVMTGLRHFRH